MLDFYLNELPKLGWTRAQYPSLDDVRKSRQANFTYTGSEPLRDLSLTVGEDATVRLSIDHLAAGTESSLFVGQQIKLGADIAGSHDLKAVPRPPDSVIAGDKISQSQNQVTYRYDWGSVTNASQCSEIVLLLASMHKLKLSIFPRAESDL